LLGLSVAKPEHGCRPSGQRNCLVGASGASTAARLSHAAPRSHAVLAGCGLQRPIDVRANQLGESNISKPNDPEQLTLATRCPTGTLFSRAKHAR
jgi:hypothetical protein